MKPIVWSIAGSDSGGGAGVQADLKAFEAFDVHGCTAIASITAQNSVAVARVEPVAPDLLDAQLSALAQDMPPRAVKTGLLGSAENVRVVCQWIDRLRQAAPVALVVDPVWRASTGASLGSDELRRALVEELLPRATLITPNRAEAAWLLGLKHPLQTAEVPEAAARLRGLGAAGVVITGGDAGDASGAFDAIDTPEAAGWLSLPRLHAPHNHGTGCVFASSAASAMALGFCTADAVVLAKMATTAALRKGYAAGQGAGPVRPVADFALAEGGLPVLMPPQGVTAREPSEAGAFAPLSERWMGLYPIVDSAEWVERVLRAGARTVQLRIKEAPTDVLDREVARAVAAARAADAQLFINDHWRLALAHGAYGVHLGQEDVLSLQPADFDAMRDAGMRLGLSTHSFWEVCRARALTPSYIACGPIHATVTKDMPWRPQGPGNLAYWCAVLEEPVVAIAGMDEVRGHEAARCGASGVAVLRGIVQAADPEAALGRLDAAVQSGHEAPRLAPPPMARSTLAGPAGFPDD